MPYIATPTNIGKKRRITCLVFECIWLFYRFLGFPWVSYTSHGKSQPPPLFIHSQHRPGPLSWGWPTGAWTPARWAWQNSHRTCGAFQKWHPNSWMVYHRKNLWIDDLGVPPSQGTSEPPHSCVLDNDCPTSYWSHVWLWPMWKKHRQWWSNPKGLC